MIGPTRKEVQRIAEYFPWGVSFVSLNELCYAIGEVEMGFHPVDVSEAHDLLIDVIDEELARLGYATSTSKDE